MTTHTRTIAGSAVKIHTSHDYPPIPTRAFDWSAVTDDYEAWTDGEGDWTSTHPVGHGATEDEALADLVLQLEDAAEEVSATGSASMQAEPTAGATETSSIEERPSAREAMLAAPMRNMAAE